MRSPTIHRYEASLLPVNAYIIEAATGVVVVDSTLGVSDGKALRGLVDRIGKPLHGALVTHAHPDHYGALTVLLHGSSVPVWAIAGVQDAIIRDDPAKEQILRPMFGDEWAAQRRFPDHTAEDGERVTFGSTVLQVKDLGPGESPHDSMWLLETDRGLHAFVGDLVYNRMHSYLADGFFEQWLANLERVRSELPPDAILYPGHGEPARARPLLDGQRQYIEAFIEAVRSADDDSKDPAAFEQEVSRRMMQFLSAEQLAFLMQLSIAPVRDRVRRAHA